MEGWEWTCGLGSRGLRSSFRSSSPFSHSEFDIFKSRSSVWNYMSLSGLGRHSKVSASSLSGLSGIKRNDSHGMRRWQSMPRLAPEGAPQAHSSQEVKMRVAQGENSMRRAKLVQKLRPAHGCLDTQKELLKTKEDQLQHSHSTAQLLELEHKISKAPSTVEELCHYENVCHQAEFHKVVELEMDMPKMRSSVESTAHISHKPTAQQTNPQLKRTLPETKNDFFREGQDQTGMEMKKLKEALREAEERAATLELQKDLALQQLYSSKESQEKALSQVEYLQHRLHTCIQAQSELQNQLSDSRSHLDQLVPEKEQLSAQASRLENSLEDLKTKLSAALSDKDRLVQEKVDLYQRIQGLEVQLQRAHLGKESFTEHVSELHSELTQDKNHKNQASRQQQSTLLMRKELHSDLSKKQASNRLEPIVEREELVGVFDQENQPVFRELREKCCKLRELQDILEQEKKNLEAHCWCLEKKVLNLEAAYQQKEEELQRMEAEFELKEKWLKDVKDKLEQEKEQLKEVAAHWNKRWLDVAMTLQSTQIELEKTKRQQLEADALNQQEQQLAKREQDLEGKNLILKNLMSQRDTEKAGSEANITTLENELGGSKELKGGGHLGIDQRTPATSKLKVQREESMTAAQLNLEREQAVQGLHTPLPSQQTKEDMEPSPVTKKQKSAIYDLIDPDQQRRFIAEQLKSLFKDRGEGEDRASPVLQRRAGSGVDHSPRAKNSLDTLSSSRTRLQDPQGPGALRGPRERAAAGPEGAQGEPVAPEQGL